MMALDEGVLADELPTVLLCAQRMKVLAAFLLVGFLTFVTTDGFVCTECCKDSAGATASCDCNVAGICVICATGYVPSAPLSAPVLASTVLFAPVVFLDAPISVDLGSVYHPPRLA
jgi:hypothetical protein